MAGKRKTTPVKPKPKAKNVKADAIIMVDDGLSPQMRLFVDHYIITMNGTESARLAKYSGDDATLAATASRLLRNDKVIRELDSRLKQFTMTANEILIRLTDVARGDIADALNSYGGIDPLEAKRRGKSHLIKRFKKKTKTITTASGEGDGEQESEILEDETEIEMYDALDALKTLAKYYNLINTSTVKIEDWKSQAIADIKAGNVKYQAMLEAFNDESLVVSLFQLAGVPIE